MQVTLAGHNLDAEIISLINRITDEYRLGSTDESSQIPQLISQLENESLTPETLSAAYARISRSDKDIFSLRREARNSVSRSRRTNERIVFGYGHASIAEHAILNLDITGISRLALEELESHRLASYTEASQRYIAMSGDFMIPDEVVQAGLKEKFESVCKRQFEGYSKLIKFLEKLYHDYPDHDRNIKAREDSRYVLPLACNGQVGVTVNARVAEWMIRNFNRSSLSEVRELAGLMHSEIKKVTPSLIKYTEPNCSLDIAQKNLEHISASLVEISSTGNGDNVELIEAPVIGERNIIAALLFSSGKGSFGDCINAVEKLSAVERKKLLISVHKCISAYEPVRREMELCNFTFSITLSSSAFAQLKRHRIATLITQSYIPELGYTIPESVVEAGGEAEFKNCMKMSDELYNTLKEKLPEDHKNAAQYALTNAHRRRVIFQANVRELVHFSRLRMDINAQWDIRSIANEMIRLAREHCPTLMLFAEGKNKYDKLSEELFGS
ncbi:FAD-dependent thymidylate synthase [bacterium]|nr:FAD-dependent thymidylate synthase [bacterium]